jgi:hypothetical protein
MRADDTILDNGDVGFDQCAGDDIEQSHVLDDNIRRLRPGAGADHADQAILEGVAIDNASSLWRRACGTFRHSEASAGGQ